MALNIRSRETEKLAEDLARLTGETKTEAVSDLSQTDVITCGLPLA